MRELLPFFTGPGRYVGNEPGAVHKDPASVDVRIALAFPDLYEVGMAYLGQKILYEAINAHGGQWAERVFAPDTEVAAVLRKHKAPLCTLESDTPLSQMDAIGFHLTHELCYTNVLYMLDLAGIAFRSVHRGPDTPLIMAGGGCTFNAEPVAPFIDVMIVGDGEELMPEVMEHIAQTKKAGQGRNKLLEILSHLPGVYIPAFFADDPDGATPHPLHAHYTSVEKRLVPDLNTRSVCTDQIVPFAQPIHDRLAVEIARGCTRGCRFCQAGMLYRPARERSPQYLTQNIAQGLQSTGYDELSFLSLSTGDYSALESLFASTFELCRKQQVAVSLPSLRVGSVSDAIMKRMASIRRTGATLAPEAGSQRLRDVINKGITEEALLEHVRLLFSHGWQQIKLYFMIGLPTETPEDLAAIADLCLAVRDCAGPGIKRLQVTAAVSPFVPKSHTPFQWERQLTQEETHDRIGFLREKFRPHKRMKLRWHMPEMSFLEGIFSRGDRRLAGVVEGAYARGAVFSSWNDKLDLIPWLAAMKEAGLEPLDFLSARPCDAALPWDHLNSGVTKSYLQKEHSRALAIQSTGDCRYAPCHNCGVCNIGGQVSTLTRQHQQTAIAPVVINAQRDQQRVQHCPQAAEGIKRNILAKRPEPPDLGNLTDKVCHYRIWHKKQGQAAYISQIELQRVLERTLRRAGIPVSFSAGFHPLPRLSFGRALPVGVHSEQEWFTLFLREHRNMKEMTSFLASAFPDGLDLVRIEALSMQKKQAQALTEEYCIAYHTASQCSYGYNQWTQAMEKSTVLLEKRTKKKTHTVDIRPVLQGIEQTGATGLLVTFDWRSVYYNPLRLVHALCPASPEASFILTKKVQHMAME